MFKKYDAYKDSGVEWIGDIPSHWEIKKLKHIGNSIIGLTYSPSDLCSVEEGTLVARSSNIFEGKFVLDRDDNVYVKSKIPPKLYLKADDILICSRNGSRDLIGKCAYIKDDSNYSFGAFTTVFRGNLNHYLFYILNSDIFKRLSGTFLTSTINQLTISNLNSISIPLPPEREMEYIKAFLHEKLSTIDQAIAIKEQQIDLLNERKQIVIQKAVTQGLNPNVPMKDSGVEWIGQIPEHWNIDRLGTILEPISKKGHADKPLLSITREKGVIVRDVEDDSENHNFIPDDLTNYKLIEAGQFGMNKMKAWQGSYGVSAYTGIVSPAYYIFRFIKPIYPEFFHWAIRSKLYVSFFGSASDGVRIGQWDLSKDRMKQIPFVFLSLEQQKTIADYLTQQTELISEGIKQYSAQIEKLKEYKTTLINDAVTGKIKVA